MPALSIWVILIIEKLGTPLKPCGLAVVKAANNNEHESINFSSTGVYTGF